MQDIPQETHHETTRLTQSAQVVLWEIDLTEVGGERYFFCNEQNEKGEPVTWQGRQYQAYPIQGTGFELNGKGSAARPTLTVSNLHGMVTGMAEDMQSLVGGTAHHHPASPHYCGYRSTPYPTVGPARTSASARSIPAYSASQSRNH